jgi:hypothetical protein
MARVNAKHNSVQERTHDFTRRVTMGISSLAFLGLLINFSAFGGTFAYFYALNFLFFGSVSKTDGHGDDRYDFDPFSFICLFHS